MTPEEFARESWRQGNGEDAPALPPLNELRRRADKFRRKIIWRNRIEYIAGGFVILAFSVIALLMSLPVMRIGAALIIAGTGLVMWQLHRRGGPLSPARDGGALPLLDYQRRELVRQRDALDSIAIWYLLPLVPGMIVFMAGSFLDEGRAPTSGDWLRLASVGIVFVAIWIVNKVAARQLQTKIDSIDAMLA